MAERCLLYYITDRTAFPGNEGARRRRLLEKISEAAEAGIDYVQLREKDLCTRDLEFLAREAVHIIAQLKTKNRELQTALLINSRPDVALAVQAAGAHLRSDDVSLQDVKRVWQEWGKGLSGAARHARDLAPHAPLIAVSCHSPQEVARAAAGGASFAVFAPVFEKKDAPAAESAGLAKLREACQARIPVLALGGVTLANAALCLEAGAAGIAAIRLFQENDIVEVTQQLRGL